MTTILTMAAIAVAVAFAAVAIGRRRHWFVLPAVVLVAAANVVPLVTSFSVTEPWQSAAVALGFATLGVLAGSPVVGLVLRFAQGGVELGDHGGIVVEDADGATKAARKEILRGGTTIGFLERLALIGAIVASQSAAIAIIVAIKGLGRFSELDDSRARERFIIGTLTSLIWASANAAAITLLA